MSRKKKNFLLENLSLTAYAAEGKSLGHLEDGRWCSWRALCRETLQMCG
jgi:hypothetical protein